MNGLLPLIYDPVTLYIATFVACKLLEYGKVEVWVF